MKETEYVTKEIKYLQTKSMVRPVIRSTKQGLEAARRLISNRRQWTQGSLYKNGAYCALGALEAVGSDTHEARKMLKESIGRRFIFPRSIMSYNDHHSHACVLALFDAAIERADKKGEPS